MPPRHAYWTIIFGNQPTSFRAATADELMPTFRQLQSKHPDAVMMWFARGRLWKSPEEAREALEVRRARPRFRDERPRRPPGVHDERPKGPAGWREQRDERPKAPAAARGQSDSRPKRPAEWREQRGERPKAPAAARGEPDSRPKGPAGWREQRGERPKGPRERTDRDRSEWRDRRPPRHDAKRQDERRGKDWRPGGSHADPRDRFKVPRDVKRKRFAQRLRRDANSPRPSNRTKKKDEDK